MFGRLASTLAPEEIERIKSAVLADLDASRNEAAQKGVNRLLRAQPRDRIAALALLDIAGRDRMSIDETLEVFHAIFRAHRDDPQVVARLGKSTDLARDIDELNAPPPVAPLFAELADALERRGWHTRGDSSAYRIGHDHADDGSSARRGGEAVLPSAGEAGARR